MSEKASALLRGNVSPVELVGEWSAILSCHLPRHRHRLAPNRAAETGASCHNGSGSASWLESAYAGSCVRVA
jgi:hypothetical protein